MSPSILLFALGGFLLGGAWASRTRSVVLAMALALCAAVAIAAGVLRYP